LNQNENPDIGDPRKEDDLNEEEFEMVSNPVQNDDFKSKISLFGGMIGEKILDLGGYLADNIQGRMAPGTVVKCGYLLKKEANSSTEWRHYYFIIRGGLLHVLPSHESSKSDFSFCLDKVRYVKELDPLETGKPNSFQVCLSVDPTQTYESESARTTVMSFLGIPIITTQSTPPNYILVLSASSQAEEQNWIRNITCVSDGLKKPPPRPSPVITVRPAPYPAPYPAIRITAYRSGSRSTNCCNNRYY
jgi:hypothetical protein